MKKILLIATILLLLLATISFTNMDIVFANIFYQKNQNPLWTYSNMGLWKFMYHYGNILPNLCGITSALLLIFGLFKKTSWSLSKENKKKTLFVLFLFLIAPGFITQTLKVTWGRPRPSEITQFGGTHEFRTPFEPNLALFGNSSQGNSFPSGHAANAFFMIFPFYIAKRRWGLIFGGAGLCYGILMAITRMVQGGHFLSDVVTSLFIVYITAEALKLILLNISIKE